MVTRIFAISFLMVILFANTSCSQNLHAKKNTDLNLPGRYTSKNKSHFSQKHYEEIILNIDSSFNYFSRIGSFIRISIKGKWSVESNLLVLNGNHTGMKKVVAHESFSPEVPRGWVKFSVYYLDNTILNYHVTASCGDTTVILKNRFESTLLPLSSVDEFYIDGSLYRYPTYYPKQRKSNVFNVKVTSKRLFINEKWQIEGAGRIRPTGLDNQLAGYVLLKENGNLH